MGEEKKGEWQPIGLLGSRRGQLLHNQVVIAKIIDRDDDDTPPQIAWAHVAYPVSMGWQLGLAGVHGLHGFASLSLHDATHFMLLPTPSVESRP